MEASQSVQGKREGPEQVHAQTLTGWNQRREIGEACAYKDEAGP